MKVAFKILVVLQCLLCPIDLYFWVVGGRWTNLLAAIVVGAVGGYGVKRWIKGELNY